MLPQIYLQHPTHEETRQQSVHRCEFEIGVEADDAEVSWYRDGKKINPEVRFIRGKFH